MLLTDGGVMCQVGSPWYKLTMGPARMTLHASDMGRPAYRAMGFEAGERVMLLAPVDASAGH